MILQTVHLYYTRPPTLGQSERLLHLSYAEWALTFGFVVFTNQPSDTPFMAGVIHGLNQQEGVINVGIGGTGVLAGVLERELERKATGSWGCTTLPM